MFTPLEQFKIIPLIRVYNDYIDLSVTNSTIYMAISVFSIIILIWGAQKNKNNLAFGGKSLIKAFFEIIYIKTEEIVNDIIGKKYNKYIPSKYLKNNQLILKYYYEIMKYCSDDNTRRWWSGVQVQGGGRR